MPANDVTFRLLLQPLPLLDPSTLAVLFATLTATRPPCFLPQSNSQLPLNILTSLVQAPARFEQRALQPLCFEIPVRGTCLSIAALRFEGHFSNQPVETQIKFIAWIGFIILTGRKLMKNCGWEDPGPRRLNGSIMFHCNSQKETSPATSVIHSHSMFQGLLELGKQLFSFWPKTKRVLINDNQLKLTSGEIRHGKTLKDVPVLQTDENLENTLLLFPVA